MYYVEKKEAIHCLSAILSSSVGSQNERLLSLFSILAES